MPPVDPNYSTTTMATSRRKPRKPTHEEYAEFVREPQFIQHSIYHAGCKKEQQEMLDELQHRINYLKEREASPIPQDR